MTLQTRAANAARTRTIPMFAALAPLLMFVGFDGVVHGVARSALHQGKLIKGTLVRGTRVTFRSLHVAAFFRRQLLAASL